MKQREHEQLDELRRELELLRSRMRDGRLQEEQVWPLAQKARLLLQQTRDTTLEDAVQVVHSLLDSMHRICRQQRRLRQLQQM